MANRSCTVYLLAGDGKRYARNTSGSSVFEAAADALAFFRKPYWQGPRPQPEDVLEVSVNVTRETHKVLVRTIDEKYAAAPSCDQLPAQSR